MSDLARTLVLGAGGVLAAACQSTGDLKPAHLAPASPEAMAVVRTVLADAMGRTRIDLGAGDPGQDPVISVLPLPIGPHEGNSPAMPTLFDILTDDAACYLRKRGEDKLHPLPNVTCKANAPG